jgi:hypothetical protein
MGTPVGRLAKDKALKRWLELRSVRDNEHPLSVSVRRYYDITQMVRIERREREVNDGFES